MTEVSRSRSVDIRWRKAADYSNDRFPSITVITPESVERRQRWQSVLDEYASLCTPQRTSTWKDQCSVQVLCLSQELEPAARNMANLLGGRVIQDEAVVSASDPLYVFGRPETMTNRVLTGMRDRAGQTSFLPAIDLPGASFIVAKLVLSALIDEPEAHLCCDALADNPPDFSALITHAEELPSATDELGTVIIQAHGDGAHATVGNVVVCGRVGEQETLLNGAAIQGCEDREDGPHCKRRGPKHAGVCALQDLRARHLVLMTCNALTIGDGQYPSTSNLVVAALEGYASSVVATHASYVANPSEILLAKATARDRDTLFNLYKKLRELRRSLDALDPFVYAGIIKPAIGTTRVQQRKDDTHSKETYEFEKALDDWQRVLTQVGQRFLEHLAALRLIRFKHGAPKPEVGTDQFLAFETQSSRFVALLHAFLSESESWRMHCSDRSVALRLLHQTIQSGKECDELLARNVLERFRNSDYALGEFGKRKSGWKSTELRCTHCGNDLNRMELSSFLFPRLSGQRLTCPTCGAFEIALPSAGQLTISAETTWQRADTVPIKATLRPGGRHGQIWQAVGWGAHLGFHITHYGHAPYLSKLVTSAPGVDAEVEFVCPSDMHPDIYSITVAAILGGQISIKRIRTQCL